MNKRIGNNRKRRKTMALSFSLIGSMLFAMPGMVFAAESNTAKEENVYATLSKDGSVQGIYVVNAYDLQADTDIIDYGSYTSLKNLTNENTIQEDGKEISVAASRGKFYYQGNLETKDLPWKIQIHYYLDGKEVDGEKLAGQTGALKVEIQLTQNTAVDASFFENYLLQATIALPAEVCTNIVADGATVANMSGSKQILFNVMGGKEKTLTITADVTDFEMDAITFKGVPMSFDINLDDIDTSELTDKTEELEEGVNQLNDGAGDLQEGTGQLQDGLTVYTSGVDRLYGGAAVLAKGVDSLQLGTKNYTDAVQRLSDGSDTLAKKTENLPVLMTNLSSAISQVQSGSEKLADTNHGAAAQITAGLNQIEAGLQQMKKGLVSMNENAIAPMLDGLGEMEIQMGTLEDGFAAANAYTEKMKACDAKYQKEAKTLKSILESLPNGTAGVSEEAVSRAESSQDTKTQDPQTTTSSETVTGEYQEDHTDTSTEHTTDEEGNPVTIITNNVYMTRENTTTVTNETTIHSETVITQVESAACDTSASGDSLDLETAQQLTGLYEDMAENAGTLHVLLNGDGTQKNPGLASVLAQCQAGVDQTKSALFTGTENQSSIKTALSALQVSLVGSDGKGGAVKSIQDMIEGVEKIKYEVSGSDNTTSLQNSLLTLNSGLTALNANTFSLPSTSKELSAGIHSLQSGLNTLNKKSDKLTDGTSSVQSGASQLRSGANALAENNDTLLKGMEALSGGVDTLKDGTQELADQTSGMDDQIMDTFEEKLSNFTGEDYDGVSFVSAKNTNVDAVQFAISTQDILIPEEEETQVVQEEQTFLDKFKSLFTK